MNKSLLKNNIIDSRFKLKFEPMSKNRVSYQKIIELLKYLKIVL